MSKKDKKIKKVNKSCCKKSCSCKKLTLVKWDYDSQPEEWKKNNPNDLEGKHLVWFGEIKKMPGHSLCLDIETGKPVVLHTEELIALKRDEI